MERKNTNDKDSKNAKIIVSSENAKPIEFKIKINAQAHEKRSYISIED